MNLTARRAVFLDRDGVINRAMVRAGKPYPPSSLAEVEIPAGTLAALNNLKQAGFYLIGITNQPDVARGTQRRAIVEEINQFLLTRLPVDEIFVCYHDTPDHCDCRKPQPGLILQAAQKYAVNPTHSFMVGDRWKDIEAGQRAGCRTVFIDYGYLEKQAALQPDKTVASLPEASTWIMSQIGL
jgi:D-glycero-D-manno-heptose 1,7-bisphosphate phosphatase